MNAGRSAEPTAVFFSCFATAYAVASVSSSVEEVAMTSTSGMTATGLKKCIPTSRSGRASFEAIAVTDRPEVLVTSRHSSETTCSTSANTACLTFSSSNTASMTRSQSA